MVLKKYSAYLSVLLLFIVGCTTDESADAYGQFEADEITVSTENSGRMIEFKVEEGDRLEEGQIVGLVDTMSLFLKKNELESMVRTIHSNIAKLESQIKVFHSQIETVEKIRKRMEALIAENASTDQQMDEVIGQIDLLHAQIDAVEIQKQTIYAEIETMHTRIAQIEDQIDRAVIINPVAGIVLSTFKEESELVRSGGSLYDIAALNVMELRVFVSGAQLPQVILGNEVEVWIDQDYHSNQQLNGVISWIASEAEFTPKMIQTKEERVAQVYAIKIRVQNPEGILKIGMPGEVIF